ncbi:MAG: hypothetical protein ACXWUG_09800 [Polyangiales bacterium]
MKLVHLTTLLLVVSCNREAAEICDKSAAEIPAPERDAHRAKCLEVVDRMKPGIRECVSRCYKTASGREAFFDCDTRCGVKIQE